MAWLVFWIVALLVSAGGIVVSGSRLRFERVVAREVAGSRRLVPGTKLRPSSAPLPPPVQAYLEKAHVRPIRTVRLRHGGFFRIDEKGHWLLARGDEYFAADPPAFVWHGRVQMAPGVWTDVRDQSVGGKGELVAAIGPLTVAQLRGPQVDAGEALRLLGELPLIPSVLADPRYVTWEAIDETSARATLRDPPVSGIFHFEGALPVRFTAVRPRAGAGDTHWEGTLTDWREVGGVLFPHELRARWIAPDLEYAKFVVERIELDDERLF